MENLEGSSDATGPAEVTRRQLRPGLTMIRRRTIKPDGRYLLFYDFEREGERMGEAGGTAPSEERGTSEE